MNEIHGIKVPTSLKDQFKRHLRNDVCFLLFFGKKMDSIVSLSDVLEQNDPSLKAKNILP